MAEAPSTLDNKYNIQEIDEYDAHHINGDYVELLLNTESNGPRKIGDRTNLIAKQGKFLLVSPNELEFDWILEDLKQRLLEGHGETFYSVGTYLLGPQAIDLSLINKDDILNQESIKSPTIKADITISTQTHVSNSNPPLETINNNNTDSDTTPTKANSVTSIDNINKTEFSITDDLQPSDSPPQIMTSSTNHVISLDVRPEEIPGLSQTDLQASVATLISVATACHAECILLREKQTEAGLVAEYLVRSMTDEENFMEVRVAVVGNVDAGKSTLLGVLTHGELDNGRGLARQKLFRFKHERETGRTSSVGNDILGFDCKGEITNLSEGRGQLDWQKICKMSSKIVTFIDLAGHEKYLKTTIFGMTGHAPDFCMLMVGSNAGVIGMTKEHLGIALALSVPVFVVVTKVDMCPENVLKETLKLIIRIVKSPGCRKIPALVQNEDDVVTCAINFTSQRLCPIFQVSNVTGLNIELLKKFLNLLNARMPEKLNDPAIYQIDETYSVPGVGTVVSGTLFQGIIRIGDVLLLGPDGLGQFQPMPIRSIQRKRLPVSEVHGGQTASFALRKIKRSQIHKGMVLAAKELKPTACWEFDAEILVLHHPTTIVEGYQAMVHCGSVRQTATIITMSSQHLRTGDKADCRFRFIKIPEFLMPNTKLIFREGRTKAVGTVTKIYSQLSGPPNKQRIPKNKTAPFPTSKTSKRKEAKQLP